MAYVIHENQLKDMLNDAMAENPWVSKEDIIKWIMSNPDIKIMASDKYWDTKSVSDYLSDKTDDEIDTLFGTLEDENWNPIEDTESSKPSKQEKIDYAKKYNENEYSKIWNDAIKWFDETDPLMENAKKVTEAYEKLRDKKNELTSYYNSWRSWDSEVYQAKLDQINQALEAAETSDEFKSIVNTIRENWWASAEDFFLHPMVDATLEKMAMHYWSTMWWEKWESLKNTLYWDIANSWVTKIWWSSKWLHNLPNTYDEYNKWDNGSDVKNDESNTKWEKKSPDITKLTDVMKFWDDVASVWWEKYLDARDEKLALALKIKWIESPEEIDKFLNKYDSWKWAKDEWKQKTLWRLSDKISQISDQDIKNEVKAAKERQEGKRKEKDDNNIYDENWKVIWKKHIDIKKKNVWDDWTPSNDDSINWVEDEKEQSVIRDAIDIASWKKKITKEDIYNILPDKAKQLIKWIDKDAKERLYAKEHLWDTDEDWYWDPDSPINWTEEEDTVKSTNEKWWKWTVKEEKKQSSKNNKFLRLTREVQKLKPNERIKYLKEHWFSVDKNWYFTKNWMKTLVYKDGQYNPKYVKPDEKEGYNERVKVEAPKQDPVQIALQKSGYQWPRDANGNFLPITDKWLDIQEGKKNLKDKSKK